MKLRIGSRGSHLALTQTRWVAQQLIEKGFDVTIQEIKTTGDKILDVPLAKVGGKGLFVKEIEEALLEGQIDLAVHSMKDMPTKCPSGTMIGAVPKRADPRDALISRDGMTLDNLPFGSKIGTSSLRRQAQLKRVRPDFIFLPVRGNLSTRMRKLSEGEVDALILAVAGLYRIGWQDRITEYIPFDICLPAIGQGALAIECRENDPVVLNQIAFLNDPETACEIETERALLTRLEGGCQTPIAGFAKKDGGIIQLEGLVANLDGSEIIREKKSAPIGQETALGIDLAESLLRRGADLILKGLSL
jgi:hydroxymethylbilane synthase